MAGFVSQCFFGKMPSLSSAEGSIWWSMNPKGPPHGSLEAIKPITERELSSFLNETVGWHAIEITAEAFMNAGAHHTQIRPYVQAAFEAVARINTHKCVIRAVDLDFGMGACLRMALAAYLNLRTLLLAELNVYDEAVLQLADGLSSSESLHKLVLDQVDLGNSGWAAVMGALRDSASIKALILRRCCNFSAISGLAAALPQIHALQVLDLSGNVIRGPSLKTLCEALSKNRSITSLSLSECGLGMPEGHAVADLLRQSPLLKSLDVSRNALGHEGCNHISEALTTSTSLQHLNLSHAGCDDSTVTEIAGAISVCHAFTTIPFSNLTSLDLGYGRITANGSLALAREARRGKLQEVRLSGNCCMETEGVNVWAEQALRFSSCKLTRLALCDCEANDEAAEALARALRPRGSLAILELASNQFTQRGISALINAARSCPRMRLLDVSFNWIGPRAMHACLAGDVSAEENVAGSLSPDSSLQDEGLQIKRELLLEFRSIEAVKCKAGLVPLPERGRLCEMGAVKSSRQRSSSASRDGSKDDQETDTDSTATQASSSCVRSRAASSTIQAFPQASLERPSSSPTSQTNSSDQPSPTNNPFLQPQAFSHDAGRLSADGYGDGGARWADLADCDGLLDGTINVPLPVSVGIPPLPPSPKSVSVPRDGPEGADDRGVPDAEAGAELPHQGPQPTDTPQGEGAINPFLDPALSMQKQPPQPKSAGRGSTNAEAGLLPHQGPQLTDTPQEEDAANPFLDPALGTQKQQPLQQQQQQQEQPLERISNLFLELEIARKDEGTQQQQQEQQQQEQPLERVSNPFLEPDGQQQPREEPQEASPFLEQTEEQRQEERTSNPFLEQPEEQRQEEQELRQEASNPFLDPALDKEEEEQRQQQERTSNPFLEPQEGTESQGGALSEEVELQKEQQHQHHHDHCPKDQGAETPSCLVDDEHQARETHQPAALQPQRGQQCTDLLGDVSSESRNAPAGIQQGLHSRDQDGGKISPTQDLI